MEAPVSLAPSALSPVELEQMRFSLATQYPLAKGILGSQLGVSVRRNLKDPDLKGRFGGLKEFISRYFPAEIVWRGRHGLDDLYDISFAIDGSESSGSWQPIPREPSSALWSAVTNPSISVQFAWSSKEESLFQAPAGISLPDDLVEIKKLKKADYQNFATEFLSSLDGIDTVLRAQALASTGSSAEFTKLMREKDLLAKWEAFRIDRASREFERRMTESGADSSVVALWGDILRLSRREARSKRSGKTVASSTQRQLPTWANRQYLPKMPESRAVAIKAMEFLSDSELSDLRLPLGAVMRSLRSLTEGS